MKKKKILTAKDINYMSFKVCKAKKCIGQAKARISQTKEGKLLDALGKVDADLARIYDKIWKLEWSE